jgi:hypothetical protein
MKFNISEAEAWEFGALGIHNPRISPLKPYFDLLERTEGLEGDVLELGVARGASIITTGLILESLGSDRKVVGIDTFSGFPNFSTLDDVSMFDSMYQEDMISYQHLERVKRNLILIQIRGSSLQPNQLSTSGDFSSTSLNMVQSKIDSLNLSHRVSLRVADLSRSEEWLHPEQKFSLVLFDLDLYQPYAKQLPSIFSSLVDDGFIYLDEYYSLKFPGPRLAVRDFVAERSGAKLIKLSEWLDFERWAITKPKQ